MEINCESPQTWKTLSQVLASLASKRNAKQRKRFNHHPFAMCDPTNKYQSADSKSWQEYRWTTKCKNRIPICILSIGVNRTSESIRWRQFRDMNEAYAEWCIAICNPRLTTKFHFSLTTTNGDNIVVLFVSSIKLSDVWRWPDYCGNATYAMRVHSNNNELQKIVATSETTVGMSNATQPLLVNVEILWVCWIHALETRMMSRIRWIGEWKFVVDNNEKTQPKKYKKRTERPKEKEREEGRDEEK